MSCGTISIDVFVEFPISCALQLAQEEIEGGWSPHVSPMIGTSLSCRRSCMTPPIDAPRLAGALMEAGFKDVTGTMIE